VSALTLLVVDDHPVVRDGIVGMVGSAEGIEVVGEASDGAEAIALAEVLAPDVVLMDLRMPRMDGVAALREFARRGIASRVVVLTTFDADADVLPAIAAGATGYLLKDASRDELLAAIRGAAAGKTVLSPEVASRLVGRVRAPEASLLTPRELEILGLIADGATNRAAGDRLHVSEGTVKTHLLSIYAKLGVGDRASAVAEGFRRGLLDTTR
jgi:DNA-binding NarL/FixJ family response regulator